LFFKPDEKSLVDYLKVKTGMVPQNVANSGVESSNFFINFGLYIVLALSTIIFIIILFLMKYRKILLEKVTPIIEKTVNSFIWNGLNQSIYFAYLKFLQDTVAIWLANI